MRTFTSHGDGVFSQDQFKHLGHSITFEKDVMVWHAETITLGNNVYVGHRTQLKGHPRGTLTIGSNVWIGQNVFMHSAGSITIEDNVGIGPNVSMLTSSHEILSKEHIILDSPLIFAPIHIGEGADIGVGSILLPGITIGKGAQIGAGSVVTKNVPDYAVVAGNPAKILRVREE